jgi:RNA polymerase sigma-70 factor (ECF subfamily)
VLFFPSKPNPYLTDPDVILMMDFKSGNKKAFEVLMERNYKRIFSFIARMLSNESVAEDLTQEVFIKIHNMASAYQPKAKLSTLLFQMARNAALNELRKQKPLSLDQVMEGEENTTSMQIEDAQTEDSSKRLEQEELAQQVRLAIDALPESQRTAVLLHRYEEMSYEEIAETMKTSPKAVKSLLNRAKENLKEALKYYF